MNLFNTFVSNLAKFTTESDFMVFMDFILNQICLCDKTDETLKMELEQQFSESELLAIYNRNSSAVDEKIPLYTLSKNKQILYDIKEIIWSYTLVFEDLEDLRQPFMERLLNNIEYEELGKVYSICSKKFQDRIRYCVGQGGINSIENYSRHNYTEEEIRIAKENILNAFEFLILQGRIPLDVFNEINHARTISQDIFGRIEYKLFEMPEKEKENFWLCYTKFGLPENIRENLILNMETFLSDPKKKQEFLLTCKQIHHFYVKAKKEGFLSLEELTEVVDDFTGRLFTTYLELPAMEEVFVNEIIREPDPFSQLIMYLRLRTIIMIIQQLDRNIICKTIISIIPPKEKELIETITKVFEKDEYYLD